MFTGVIEGVGKIKNIKSKGKGLELEVNCEFDLETSNVGDSISVNGCCLTITSRLGRCFWADVSEETFNRTTFKYIKIDDPVNLERAMKVGSRFEGHIVQGHVDSIGKIEIISKKLNSIVFSIGFVQESKRYIVEKGSIAVDGVSLTVNSVENNRFFVSIIPHTSLKTTFSALSVGSYVNLEVDIIGKYVEKLGFLDSQSYRDSSKVTKEFLKKHGF